jgi:hypothetical protein
MKKKQKKKFLKKVSRKKTRRPNALEKATAAYFASLSPEVLEEENRLGAAVAHAASHVDFDADS